jgi:membrane protease YdiL (CAAX protease family)
MAPGKDTLAYSESDTIQTSASNWSWKDLLIIVGGILGVFIIAFLVLLLIVSLGNVSLEQLTAPTFAQSLALATLESLALIGGVYFLGIRRKGYRWDSVGLRPTPWYWLAIAGGATFVVIPIVSLITLVVLLASGQSLENPQMDFLLPGDLTLINALYMLVLAGIVAPFAEELLFRGVFYSMLRQKWSVLPSVLLSSFIFGLIHGNLAVGLTGFLMGIVAALVFEYSKSLWTSFVVHAVNNSARIALLYLLYLFFGDSLTL